MENNREMNEAVKNELELDDLEKVNGGRKRASQGGKPDPVALARIAKMNLEARRQWLQRQEEEKNTAE